MTQEGWCVTTPVPSALGGITQEYVLHGVIPVSPEEEIPFSDHLLFFLAAFNRCLSFPLPSWCFFHLPNSYCAQVLIVGSASGGTQIKTYVKALSFPCFSAWFPSQLALSERTGYGTPRCFPGGLMALRGDSLQPNSSILPNTSSAQILVLVINPQIMERGVKSR